MNKILITFALLFMVGVHSQGVYKFDTDAISLSYSWNTDASEITVILEQ